MKRFVEGVDRGQSTFFPVRLEDWIGDDNPVRMIDVFVDEPDFGGLGFDRVAPLATGRLSQRDRRTSPSAGGAPVRALEPTHDLPT